MRSFGRTSSLLALMLQAAEAGIGAQISIGISIGPPPEPRMIRVRPPRPSSDVVWVDGYWYPVGHRYTWHDGYWTVRPRRTPSSQTEQGSAQFLHGGGADGSGTCYISAGGGT
jgi:hypothetical protein